MKVRDRFWLFASRAHDDDVWLGKTMKDRFTRWSRITPAEGAAMLDIPNVIMIVSDGMPPPYSDEAYGYMESFCRMKNVMWSVTGSGGFRAGNEEKFIVHLAEKYPNVSGAFAYDLMGNGQESHDGGHGSLLSEIRATLDTACRPLSMWMTMYTHDLPGCDPAPYEPFDALSLWTWHYQDLDRLEENFALLERKFPRHGKYLGVYMLDYPSGESIPVEYMRKQCEYGLALLQEKRIDGMIFLTNCVMGVGLPSERWLREWIDSVKNIELDE